MSNLHRKIERDEFFYVMEDNYDEHIEVAIPFYRLMHEELVRCTGAGVSGMRILDLGAGTGKTAAVLLATYRKSTARLMELFDEMLKHARSRLATFGDRVEYNIGDFMEVPLGEAYDVCVSSLAIHHQTAQGKQELFRRIHQALASGGRFLMIDWTRFVSPFVQELAAQAAEQYARERVLNAEILRAWCEHWRTKNIPDTVEDLCDWLKSVGFVHAECVVRYYGMALICAEKQS